MPFDRYELVTPLKPEVVLLRLSGLVRERRGFWQLLEESVGSRPENSAPFVGKIEGNNFRIHRVIRYRNSFLPRITGSVAPFSSGTKVRITMHLHPAVAVFILLWFGMVGVAMIGALSGLRESPTSLLVPVGMLLFGAALTCGGFYPEVRKARQLLEKGICGAKT